METVCVGIDTGGTFTDLVAVELERGRHHYHKVPTLTADSAKGILDGIVELLDRNGLDRAAVKLLVLGTTLATNAVLQGRWARTGADHDAGLPRCSRTSAAAPAALFQPRYPEADAAGVARLPVRG
jgi:predicted NBD/HSP70 family sugar kinase